MFSLYMFSLCIYSLYFYCFILPSICCYFSSTLIEVLLLGLQWRGVWLQGPDLAHKNLSQMRPQGNEYGRGLELTTIRMRRGHFPTDPNTNENLTFSVFNVYSVGTNWLAAESCHNQSYSS